MNTSHDIAARAMQDFFLLNVPLTRAAELSFVSYDGKTLVCEAPLAPNINDKGTAFGGSTFVLCVAAAWGMSKIKSQELGLEGELVVAKSEIEYLRPLSETLRAEVVSPNDEAMRDFKQCFETRGRASFVLESVINNHEGKPAVRFKGKYALLKK